MLEVIYFLAVIFVFALLSGRLKDSPVTGQMVFIVAGMLLAFVAYYNIDFKAQYNFFLLISELALVLVLFTDASRIGLQYTIKEHDLPLRMLIIGMPLTIILGIIFATVLLTDLSIWEAAILGAVLAPTDAALGQIVVENKRLPSRIRRTLEIESGLNDGLAVPFLLLFLTWSIAEETFAPTSFFIITALQQIGFGVLIGLAVGLCGSWLLIRAKERGKVNETYQKIGLLSLAILAWLIADQLGGNGFIAAYVGGLAAGYVLKDVARTLSVFTQTEGQFLVLAVFFFFGIMLVQFLPALSWPIIIYAILSLTLIRMLPVAISLLKTKLNRYSVLFMGWFGPRGLASLVLIFIAIEKQPTFPGEDTLMLAVLGTVLFSVFAHGISASTLSKRYSSKMDELTRDILEKSEEFTNKEDI
ncbi:MAG: sodium:proton antiporter [Euryarchaeota archaeon]|nr:sodium:proton antiporter [Euryarchaeota archaeon]